MNGNAAPRFRHDCVIYIDRWQNEELGKVEVREHSLEFSSANRHTIMDIDTLQEVGIEGGIVNINVGDEIHRLRFLKRPPYQKWYSAVTYYDNDEQSSRQFAALIYSAIKARKDVPSVKEKTIIKESVLTPCKYCGGLIPQTAIVCPLCGASKK